jgi:hypothetical protein
MSSPTNDPTIEPVDDRHGRTSDTNDLEIPVTDTQTVAPAVDPASQIVLPAHPTLPSHYTMDDDPAPAPDAPDTTPVAVTAPRVRRTPRVRTVVFGLVMLAISVVSLVALMTDVQVDSGVVGLGLLIGAGAALVAGGAAAAVRESRGGPGAVH